MIMSQRLGDMIEITNGFAFKSSLYVDEGVRVVRITNVQKGKVVDDTPRFYPETLGEELSKYQINANDILMALTGNVGRVGLFPQEMLPAFVNQRVCRIKPTSKLLDDKFLFYLLNSDKFEHDAIVNSSGVAQLNLSTKWVENYKIPLPLPSLAEQKKIAAILDTADRLRQKDAQLIAKYNALSQSLFLDMFGDPFHGDTFPLSANLDILGGYAFKSSDFVDTGIPLIKIGTVNKGYFDTNSFSFLPDSFSSQYSKWLVIEGDILMSLTGTVGKDDYGNVEQATGEYTEYFLNQRVAKISPVNDNYLPKFLFGLFSNNKTKKELTRISRGVRQANISNRDINALKMIKPPISEQEKYVNAIKTIEAQKQQAQAAQQQSGDLFNSLLQRAFKGELTT